tara:strand:- start:1892 stop:2515 length:624 start_codon:yes stop_codon:yes gene_type:complete
MIRKSKKGNAVTKREARSMGSCVDYLQDRMERVWMIASPDSTKELIAEVVEGARSNGDYKTMLQAAKVMSEFLKIAAQSGVQMLDIQRKMDSGQPENQVNVQVNSVSSVPSLEEAQREIERYCEIVGSSSDGRGLIGRTSGLDGEVSEDHIGRETGGPGRVDADRIAILSPEDCPPPAEPCPTDPVSTGAGLLATKETSTVSDTESS